MLVDGNDRQPEIATLERARAYESGEETDGHTDSKTDNEAGRKIIELGRDDYEHNWAQVRLRLTMALLRVCRMTLIHVGMNGWL